MAKRGRRTSAGFMAIPDRSAIHHAAVAAAPGDLGAGRIGQRQFHTFPMYKQRDLHTFEMQLDRGRVASGLRTVQVR